MRRAWLAAVAAGLALAVGACTDNGGPEVATVDSAPTPSTSPSAGPADPLAQELQFVACMRQEGIADMPDPVPGDTSGRSAVRYALDVMGKGSDDVFQTALDTCMSLLPAPEPAEPPSDDDLAGYRRFAQCMRDNGVPEFPDPGPDGSMGVWFVETTVDNGGPITDVAKIGDHVVINISSPTVSAAFETCKGQLPNNDD